MGGDQSVEFMLRTEAGEDSVVACGGCGYAANVEKATSRLEESTDGEGLPAPEKFPTPDVRTIEDLVQLEGANAPADRQIKTLV